MRITFRARLPRIDARAASSALGRVHLRIAKMGAEAFRQALVKRHRAGQGPDGPYPKNAKEYRAEKIRFGFSGVTGNRTRTLGKIDSWDIKSIPNGWAVSVDDNQLGKVRGLRAKGYKFGVARSDVDETRRIRREQLESFSIRQYTTTRSIG